MGWTNYAINNGYVRKTARHDKTGQVFLEDFPDGEYLASGKDVNGKAFRVHYRVDSYSTWNSVPAMWRDFNGRWGLNRLYHRLPDGTLRLLCRKK